MNRHSTTAVVILLSTVAIGAPALARPHSWHPAHGHAKKVAYDAKDRKYYSVDYAKAHGMHDKGGDQLIIIPRSKLPHDAKLSHAMHGVEP